MRNSFITTVFNEESTITEFLTSLSSQSRLPDEIIIVDGGSDDNTEKIISQFKFPRSVKKVFFLTKKGNRSVGRNEAIRNASGDIIVCSDAGNMLDEHWIENIVKPFADPKVGVVAGYYKGLAKSVFERCVIPYALVMPDKVDPSNFLPATRSIAFRKKVWEKVGKFDERLSHNEDYAFAKALQKNTIKIAFRRDAIVYWFPRSTLKEVYIMFLRFAYGDAEAGILRPKVALIFFRYITGIILMISAIIMQAYVLIWIIVAVLIFYSIWAVKKNYRYVNESLAFLYLPLLQFTSDVAVMLGTIMGSLKIWDIQKTR